MADQNYDVRLQLGGLNRAAPLEHFPGPPAMPTRRVSSGPDASSGLAPPIYQSDMVFKDIGSTGLRQFAGWVREEFLPQLQGREAARAYREMADNSAVVGSILFAINSAMRKVDWRVDPAESAPQSTMQAEFIEGCMSDMSHTWTDFVTEQLSMLTYGFAPHEIVYKRSLGKEPGLDPNTGLPLPKSDYDDGLIRWRRLPLRGQDTIIKWFFSGSGEVTGMTQQPWNGPIIDLPIQKLLLFRPTSHKNNPEGRSILRTAYRSWYFSKRMEELEAILFERMGGIPTIYVPKQILDLAATGNANAAAQVAMYKSIATNVRIDEQMGMILPSDLWEGVNGAGGAGQQYRFELTVPQGGRGNAVDSDKAITRYNVNIMTSVMADFLQLGHESRGTQSLATVKTDMFFQAMEGFLNSNADVMNRHGVPRLTGLNGMDPESNPSLRPDMPQRTDLDVLSNFILRLSQAGMPLFPNETLQEYLADAAGMPDISEDANFDALQTASLEQETAPPPEANADPEGGGTQKPSNDLQKMIAAAIARRILKMGGSAHTPKRKRRS